MGKSTNQIHRLHHANVFLEGLPLLGRAEEVELPDLKWKTGEHKALGMNSTPNYPTVLEGMKAKFKWSSLYPEIFAMMADPFQMLRLQVYASLQVYSGLGLETEVPVVIFLRGWFSSQKQGKFAAGANVETDSELEVVYYKMCVAGKDVIEVDAHANIYAVNGDDKMATLRANLGI